MHNLIVEISNFKRPTRMSPMAFFAFSHCQNKVVWPGVDVVLVCNTPYKISVSNDTMAQRVQTTEEIDFAHPFSDFVD